MSDRWTVRECPVHGLLTKPMRATSRSGTRYCCPICYRDVSERFDVVRAVGARSSDPDTSKLAAFRQAPRSGSQRHRVLEALQRYGPMSAREIENVTGIKGAWKRVSELKQGDLIYEARTVMDAVTQTEVTVYAFKRWSAEDPASGEGTSGGKATPTGRESLAGPADGADVAGTPVSASGDHRAGAGDHQQVLFGGI